MQKYNAAAPLFLTNKDSLASGHSGKYFAGFRNNGKLIWRAVDTDVPSIAAQRLPDKITEAKDEQRLVASVSDPRTTACRTGVRSARHRFDS